MGRIYQKKQKSCGFVTINNSNEIFNVPKSDKHVADVKGEHF
jgi:hypothetical protein